MSNRNSGFIPTPSSTNRFHPNDYQLRPDGRYLSQSISSVNYITPYNPRTVTSSMTNTASYSTLQVGPSSQTPHAGTTDAPLNSSPSPQLLSSSHQISSQETRYSRLPHSMQHGSKHQGANMNCQERRQIFDVNVETGQKYACSDRFIDHHQLNNNHRTYHYGSADRYHSAATSTERGDFFHTRHQDRLEQPHHHYTEPDSRYRLEKENYNMGMSSSHFQYSSQNKFNCPSYSAPRYHASSSVTNHAEVSRHNHDGNQHFINMEKENISSKSYGMTLHSTCENRSREINGLRHVREKEQQEISSLSCSSTQRPHEYHASHGMPSLYGSSKHFYSIENKENMKVDSSLKPATSSYSLKNGSAKTGKRKKMYSDYIGVTYNKTHSKYQACITHYRKQHYLGRYRLAVDAAKAYDESAKLLKSKEWKINFVSEEEFQSAKQREEQMVGSGGEGNEPNVLSKSSKNQNSNQPPVKIVESTPTSLSNPSVPSCDKMDDSVQSLSNRRNSIEDSTVDISKAMNYQTSCKQNLCCDLIATVTPTQDAQVAKRRKITADISQMNNYGNFKNSSISEDNLSKEISGETGVLPTRKSVDILHNSPPRPLPSMLSKSILRKLQKAALEAKKHSKPTSSRYRQGSSSSSGGIRNRTLEAVSALITLNMVKGQTD